MKPLGMTLAFFLPLCGLVAFVLWRPSSDVVDVPMAVAAEADGERADESGSTQSHTAMRPIDGADARPMLPAGDSSSRAAVLAVVVPKQRVALRASEDGLVASVAGDLDGSFDAASVMVQIDNTRAQAEIQRQQVAIAAASEEVARAEVQLRQTEFTRDVKKRLAEGGAIARNVYYKWQFETAAAEKVLAAARQREAIEREQLTVLQQQLAAYAVVAPIRGRVAEVIRGPGEYVRKGEIILWMESEERQLKVVLEQDHAAAQSPTAIDRFVIQEVGGAEREFTRSPQSPLGDPSAAWTIFFDDAADHLNAYATGQVLRGSLVLDADDDRI